MLDDDDDLYLIKSIHIVLLCSVVDYGDTQLLLCIVADINVWSYKNDTSVYIFSSNMCKFTLWYLHYYFFPYSPKNVK